MLIRVADEGAAPIKLPSKKLASKMVTVFNKATGHHLAGDDNRLSPSLFRLLCGLADDLPAGHEVLIFQHVLHNWSSFKSLVVAVQNLAEDAGETVKYLHHSYPHIPTIRKYWAVAVELYQMDLQSELTDPSGQKPSPTLIGFKEVMLPKVKKAKVAQTAQAFGWGKSN